jgi:tripartite ATP-independent transporter DctM subunit
MSTLVIAGVLLALLLFLLAGGVWIAIALGVVGWAGLAFFTDTPPDINLFQAFWGSSASWTIAALPLFIWMGEILYRTRLSEEMFAGLAPWLDWLPGRLMHVNVLACGIFGTVSGSSAATCATVAKVALPELRKRGYDEKTCLGSLCGAGTLGILLPPSIIMVVYAVAAEVSILKVFMAGILPGALLMLLFSGYIVVWALLNPDRTPKERLRLPLREKLHRSRLLIPCLLLIFFVIAVMATGWATATEAAAFGVLGALFIALMAGGLSAKAFRDSVMGAMRLSCMIMLILAGAAFLSFCMAFTGIPRALADWVVAIEPSRYALLAILGLVYLVLGTALDGVSMIVLTTSVVIPMVQKVGIDLVWFGIFIVLLVEIAEVTPPLGFNMFVLQTMSGRDSTFVAAASLPFFAMMILALVLITAFPALATWLPEIVITSVSPSS